MDKVAEILDQIFSTRIGDSIYPIVAGSFPTYYWMKAVGLVDSIPDGVDIDVYCIAPDHKSAMELYNRLVQQLSGIDYIQIHLPQVTEFYTTWATHPYFIVSQFDISIARVWMEDKNQIKWIEGESPLDDAKNRQIKVMRIVNPIKEVYRIVKYAKRGFSIDKQSILKLFLEWENMSQREKTLAVSQIGVMTTSVGGING